MISRPGGWAESDCLCVIVDSAVAEPNVARVGNTVPGPRLLKVRRQVVVVSKRGLCRGGRYWEGYISGAWSRRGYVQPRRILFRDRHFTQRIHRDTINTDDADTNDTDKREHNDTDRSKKQYIHELTKNHHYFCTGFPCLYIGHGRLRYTREPLPLPHSLPLSLMMTVTPLLLSLRYDPGPVR